MSNTPCLEVFTSVYCQVNAHLVRAMRVSEGKQPRICVGCYFIVKLFFIQIHFDVFSVWDEAFCYCGFHVACGP
jgi:hypothetical protein